MQETKDTQRQQETLQALFMSEQFPIIRPAEGELDKYKKIPLLSIAALGAAFAQLPTAARTLVQTAGTATEGPLFLGINPKNIAAFMQDNAQILPGGARKIMVNRMRLKSLTAPTQGDGTVILPFNPVNLLIAASLISIEKKLDTLQKTAQDILQFLALEKQARQRGNLNMLSEFFEEYKQQCDNEKLCALRNTTVQEIKREAHQDILFYQEQISRRLAEQKTLHSTFNAQALQDAVINDFYEYQLACYLYALSSFMDVLLQKDFESITLQAAIQKMQHFMQRYTQLYDACHAQMAEYQKTAIENQLMDGLGLAAKTVGKKLSTVAFLREKTVDKVILNAGKTLDTHNHSQQEKRLEKFAPLQDNRMQPFVDNILTLDALYNRNNALLTDGENLYVLQSA